MAGRDGEGDQSEDAPLSIQQTWNMEPCSAPKMPWMKSLAEGFAQEHARTDSVNMVAFSILFVIQR